MSFTPSKTFILNSQKRLEQSKIRKQQKLNSTLQQIQHQTSELFRIIINNKLAFG
jgi:hypothetical protein